MTGEEMERAIAFVLEQQATLVANQNATEKRLHRLEDGMGAMREVLVGTLASVQQLTERIDQLTDRVDKLAMRVEEIGERLDTFIVVVERYITSHGNGHTPPPQP